MFVYWGLQDSGKGHMKKYAKMNQKTIIFYYDETFMRKIEPRRITNYYYDNEFITDTYENKSNSSVKLKKRGGNSSINSVDKFQDFWGKVKGVEPLTHEILSNNYDTIFDGGDIFLMNTKLPEFFILDNITRLRSSCNIVPYHTDLEHYYLSKLDNFLENSENFQSDNDLMVVWNDDKERVFKYLDQWEKRFYNIVNRLKKYKISYQYFNLGTDSYVDTYGWKNDLYREYSYIERFVTKTDIGRKNYEKCKDIIKEYIQSRNQKEFKLL